MALVFSVHVGDFDPLSRRTPCHARRLKRCRVAAFEMTGSGLSAALLAQRTRRRRNDVEFGLISNGMCPLRCLTCTLGGTATRATIQVPEARLQLSHVVLETGSDVRVVVRCAVHSDEEEGASFDLCWLSSARPHAAVNLNVSSLGKPSASVLHLSCHVVGVQAEGAPYNIVLLGDVVGDARVDGAPGFDQGSSSMLSSSSAVSSCVCKERKGVKRKNSTT